MAMLVYRSVGLQDGNLLFWADFQVKHFQVCLKINHQPLNWCVMDRVIFLGTRPSTLRAPGCFLGICRG